MNVMVNKMSTNNIRMISQHLSNTIPSDIDVPVYCVIRMTSSHRGVDNVLGVYFDKDDAKEFCKKVIDSLPQRSKEKVYIQTSVLGK